MTDHRPRFSHRRDRSSTATRSWESTHFTISPTLTANSNSPPRINLHIAFCAQQHDMHLAEPVARTATAERRFSYFALHVWNALPPHVISADSLDSFKARLSHTCLTLSNVEY